MYERIENLGLDFVCNFTYYLLELCLVRQFCVIAHDFFYMFYSFYYCLGCRSCYK